MSANGVVDNKGSTRPGGTTGQKNLAKDGNDGNGMEGNLSTEKDDKDVSGRAAVSRIRTTLAIDSSSTSACSDGTVFESREKVCGTIFILVRKRRRPKMVIMEVMTKGAIQQREEEATQEEKQEEQE